MSKEGEATGSDEPTLKDIEKHLCQQDKKLEIGNYSSGYMFGGSLVIVAISLLAAGRYVLLRETNFLTFCILLAIGGFAVVLFAWFKQRKIKRTK